MKGYILGTIKNTNDWVEYDDDRSMDYKEFLKGQTFMEKELPLFYRCPKKSYLNKIKSAIMLQSSGPDLVNKRLKEVLEVNTDNAQFFEVKLCCDNEKIEGFYALHTRYQIPCVDIKNSEYTLKYYDPNNPHYSFSYMKLKDNLFNEENNFDLVRCKESSRSIVVSERIKKALFDAKLKGLEFSDSIDMTYQDRTVYERI
jgi:hypothetical protein